MGLLTAQGQPTQSERVPNIAKGKIPQANHKITIF